MPMKRTSLALAATALVGLTALPAADAKKGHHSCAARGAKTLRDNGQARLYKRKNRKGDVNVYGCLRSTGKKTRLGFRGDCAVSVTVDKVRLAGKFAAYVETSCNIDTTNSFV